MESRKTIGSGRISSRRRILHTCGVSGLAIAHHAYAKAQDLNGPIGSMAKRVAKIAKFIEPLLYASQYLSLALLSFVDDRILAVERIVEIVFPPSKYVFNKIDQCVQIVEILPGKLDDATNKVYLVIHQFPLLDWLLLRVISWLNFWVSVLMETTKEKEIMVDKSCTECNVELATVEDEASKEFQTYPVAIADREVFPHIAETPQAKEAERVDVMVMKSTYEEDLDKGTTENTEKEDLKQSDIGDTEKEDQKEINAQQSDIGDTEKEDQKEKHAQQSDVGDTEKEDQEEKHAQQSDSGDTGKEDQEEKHTQQSDSGDTEKEDQKEEHTQQSDSGDKEKEDQKEEHTQQSDQKEELTQQSDIGDTKKEDQKEEHTQQSDIGDTGKKDQKEKLSHQSDIGEKETNEGGGNNKSDESSETKTDILELFDAAWHK